MKSKRTLDTRGQLYVPDGEEIIDARDDLLATQYKLKPNYVLYRDSELNIPFKDQHIAANQNNELIVLARLAQNKKNVMEVYDANNFNQFAYVKKSDLEAVTTFSNTLKNRFDDTDVFSPGKLDDDIRQGSAFGNCFLLSGINAIADRVGGQLYLRRMVRQDNNGTSVVRLYHPIKKKFVYYRVDNTYYCKGKKNLVSHKYMWIHLIEKAYSFHAMKLIIPDAKLHKYKIGTPSPDAVLNGGFPVCALELLTGETAAMRRIAVPLSDMLCIEDVRKYLAYASSIDEIMQVAGAELFLRLIAELEQNRDINIDLLVSELTFAANDNARNVDEKGKEEVDEQSNLEQRIHQVDLLATAISQRALQNPKLEIDGFRSKLKMYIKTFFNNVDGVDNFRKVITRPDLLTFLIYVMDKTNFIDRYKSSVNSFSGVLKVEEFYRLYNCIQASITNYEALINPLSELDQSSLTPSEKEHLKAKNYELALLAELSQVLNEFINSRECKEHIHRSADMPCGLETYTDSAMELFATITKTLEYDYALMVASTRQEGQINVKGLLPGHAYTVIATLESLHSETIKPIKYIVVKNPWGNTGIQYEVNKGYQMTAESVKDLALGCFAVELNHFIACFESYTTGQFTVPNQLPDHVKQQYDSSFSANMSKSRAMIALGVGSVGGASLIPASVGLGLLAIPTAPAAVLAVGVSIVFGFVSYLLGVRRAQKDALAVHVAAKAKNLEMEDFVMVEIDQAEMQEQAAGENEAERLRFNLFSPSRVTASQAKDKSQLPQLSRDLRNSLQAIHQRDIHRFITKDGVLQLPANKIDYHAFRYFIIRDILCAPDLRTAYELSAQYLVSDEVKSGVDKVAEHIRTLLDAVIGEYHVRCMNGEYDAINNNACLN